MTTPRPGATMCQLVDPLVETRQQVEHRCTQISLTLWCGVCVSDIRTFAASPHQGLSCAGHEANLRFLEHLLGDSILKVSQPAASSNRPRIKRKIPPQRDCSRNLGAPSAAMRPRPQR